MKKSEETKAPDDREKSHAQCVALRDRAIACPRVKFMLESIEALGCKIGAPENFISCVELGPGKAGGFQSEVGKLPHIFLAEAVGYGPRQVH